MKKSFIKEFLISVSIFIIAFLIGFLIDKKIVSSKKSNVVISHVIANEIKNMPKLNIFAFLFCLFKTLLYIINRNRITCVLSCYKTKRWKNNIQIQG